MGYWEKKNRQEKEKRVELEKKGIGKTSKDYLKLARDCKEN